MRSTVLLLLIGIFFLFSVMSQFAAMYTYWWFAIFRPHEWAWDGTIKELRLTIVIAAIFLGQAIYHKKIPKINNPIALLMLALLLNEAIANYLNGCADLYIVRTRTLSELFILAFVVLITTEIIEQKKHLYWLIAVIALSIGFHSGKGGIHALLTGGSFYGAHNLSGLFSGSNAFALGTGILIFFMIISFQCIKYIPLNHDDKKTRMAVLAFQATLLIMILGSIYNIIALSSRGSFFATAAGITAWIILHEKRKKIIPVFIVFVGLTLAFVPLPENYEERLSSAFADQSELDNSAASRPHFWATAYEIAKDHPLGVGPGCFPPFYNMYDSSNGYYGLYRSVHSSHFQVLSDTGFIGILIWLLLFIVSLSKLWSIRKEAKYMMAENEKYKFYFLVCNALISSTLVFLIGGSFYEYAYNDITWLTWGLVIATERLFKKEFGDHYNYKNAGKKIPGRY